jgi:lactate permease
MPLTFLNWLLALSPVIVVLVLMLGLDWGGSKAGPVGWAVAVAVGAVHFGAGISLLAYSQVKGLLLTLDVLYVIWNAVLLFHVFDQAGAVEVIARRLPSLTGDRLMQALLLGWVFASFLQGFGGFGVPVAVVAPLLVGIGFSPLDAVVMSSIGHGWAVTFGSLALAFQALIATSGLPGQQLAPESAWLLGVAGLFSGGVVAHVHGGWRSVLRATPALLILGLVMGGVMYALATSGLWTLGSTAAGLAGLAVGVLVARLPLYRADDRAQAADPEQGGPSLAMAMVGYAVLIVIAFALNALPPVEALFNRVVLSIDFPELATAYGWINPAGPGRRISIFGHTGAILFYTSAITYGIYRLSGYYRPGALGRIAGKMVKGAAPASLGILALVEMAVVMTHAGMTDVLARGLSAGIGLRVYPLVAPFIGALGAFMTGSNTNSNVVFAALQQQTADLLGLSVTLILAAQTAGGAVGSVLAPAKLIVGCSTVGLAGDEGRALAATLGYGLFVLAAIAAAVWLAAML